METLAQEPISVQWLYSQGWTVKEAAEYLKVNKGHLSRVLSGNRQSKRLLRKVALLPYKTLKLRQSK